MDKLDDLFIRQSKLQKAFEENLESFNEEKRQQYTKDNILAMLDETHEILRETNWKHWRKKKKKINKESLKEELVDALHFYINLCLVWGFTSDDIYKSYIKKDEKIYNRIKKGY